MAGMRAMILVLVLLFTEWQANCGHTDEELKVDAVSTEKVIVDGVLVDEPTIIRGRKMTMTINNGLSAESERKGAVAAISKILDGQVVGKFGYQSGKDHVNAAGNGRFEETNEAAFVVFNSDYHSATHHPPRHN